MIRIGRYALHIAETFTDFKSQPVQIGMRTVTDTFIFVQFQIVDAPVVGRQRRDHLVLLLAVLRLLQQLILQDQPLFELFLLDPVCRFRGLTLQQDLTVLSGLYDDKAEHQQHHGDRQRRLNDTSPHGSLGYIADPVGDHALPDQISQLNVRACDRDKGEGLTDIVISKRDDASFSGFKLLLEPLIRIRLLERRALHGVQQVVLLGKTSENGIGQRGTVSGIQVAERGSVGTGRHGHTGKHLLHIHGHKADGQGLPLEG